MLARLSRQFYTQGYFLRARGLLQHVLELCETQEIPSAQITHYQIQLAETFDKLGQIDKAKELFEELELKVNGDHLRDQIRENIERLHYQSLIKD